MTYTREEIIKNIRYNENLIKSYQNSVNRINSQIHELTSLKSKMQSYQVDFSNRENIRRNRVVNGFGGYISCKFISSYVNGMKNLIAGSDYRRAYNSISSGIRKVENKIIELRGINEDYKSRIGYCRNRIAFWNSQLKVAES